MLQQILLDEILKFLKSAVPLTLSIALPLMISNERLNTKYLYIPPAIYYYCIAVYKEVNNYIGLDMNMYTWSSSLNNLKQLNKTYSDRDCTHLKGLYTFKGIVHI